MNKNTKVSNIPVHYLMVTFGNKPAVKATWLDLMVTCEKNHLEIGTDQNGSEIELTKNGKKVGFFTEHVG